MLNMERMLIPRPIKAGVVAELHGGDGRLGARGLRQHPLDCSPEQWRGEESLEEVSAPHI